MQSFQKYPLLCVGLFYKIPILKFVVIMWKNIENNRYQYFLQHIIAFIIFKLNIVSSHSLQ